MKRKIGLLTLVLVIPFLLPFQVLAQDIRPPTCCDNEDPPPDPPPGGDSIVLGTEGAIAIPQVSISDSTLSALGMTRSVFLDSLAAAMFPDANQTISLAIPVVSLTSDSGSSTATMVYYQIEKSLVAPAVIDALDFLLITNGQTYVVVVFTHD